MGELPPKAQSIRNKTGEKYRALIQAFVDSNTPNKKLCKLSQSDDGWISEIENPKHQILVRILTSELKKAKHMINDIIPPKQRIDIYDHQISPLDTSFRLTEIEIRALQHLLSKEFQSEWKLRAAEYGALLNEDNRPVFKVATLDAIHKAYRIFIMNRKLLTSDGYQKLLDELNYLLRTERPEITRIVSWATSLGDRSENADYTYNKRKLGQIDHRIRFLPKLFDDAQKLEYNPQQESKAYFGAWVTLEDEEGKELTFRIVGYEEIYQNNKYSSLNSPMTKACLGKEKEDKIKVVSLNSKKRYTIIDICYKDIN